MSVLREKKASILLALANYNSEKLGVQALGELLQARFGVTAFFCDVPNLV